MPELPEVETVKNDLCEKLPGLTILSTRVYDARVINGFAAKRFADQLQGRTICDVQRRAKALILSFQEGGYLVIQLKMTGHLIYGEDLKAAQNLKETKVVFQLSDGHYLNYNDHRLFGVLSFVQKLDDLSYLKTLGPEPLDDDLDPYYLLQALKRRKAPIKTLLMNQNFLAGIGNIYASEILFSARINPCKSAHRLTKKEVASLQRATQDVLHEAIRYRGTSMRNYRDLSGKKGQFMNRIKVYGREREKCFICQAPIKRIIQSGRSTFFCGKCQK